MKESPLSPEITIYGAGYVGLVTGACLSKSGHTVRVLDIDRGKLDSLAAAKTPFFEPELDDVLAEAIAAGRLTFANPEDISGDTPFVYIAVGTPSTAAGSADLRYVRDVIDRLAQTAPSGTVVVMKSTVPPGTGTAIAERLAQGGVGYVSNPEFLREGSAVADWYHTDRIVLGGQAEHVGAVATLYADIDAPIVRCDITSAELVKYASNAFLATKISFVNEIASLCEITGADITAVAAAVGMDHRIGPDFLRAGIGYGGSCFPKDTRALDYLSRFKGYDFNLLRAVIEVNARQRMLPVKALRDRLGDLAGQRVAVLGLAFKPDTDDTRESPGMDIAQMLLAEGAIVTGYDPVAHASIDDAGFTACDTLEATLEGVTAAIVATEWPCFVTADWSALIARMTGQRIVFDGRNVLDQGAIHAAGGTYLAVGRPSTP